MKILLVLDVSGSDKAKHHETAGLLMIDETSCPTHPCKPVSWESMEQYQAMYRSSINEIKIIQLLSTSCLTSTPANMHIAGQTYSTRDFLKVINCESAQNKNWLSWTHYASGSVHAGDHSKVKGRFPTPSGLLLLLNNQNKWLRAIHPGVVVALIAQPQY